MAKITSTLFLSLSLSLSFAICLSHPSLLVSPLDSM